MRLLVDMNLSPKWTDLLIAAGFQAAHWSAVGLANAPDSEIMEYATTHNFVILTHDLDFGSILAITHGEKPSVVQVRAASVSPLEIGPKVIAALRQMSAELEAGALLTIDAERTRIRVLPLLSRP